MRLELLNRHQLQRGHAQLDEMRNLARHVQERPALVGQVRRKEGPDVELIEDKLVKTRRDIPAFVPREIPSADDAFARKGRFQLAGIGVPLGPLAPLADDVEHVALSVLHARDEAQPMALRVAREQACVVPQPAVEIPEHMDGAGLRRPDTERGAIGDEIGPHRGAGMDVIKRGRHEYESTIKVHAKREPSLKQETESQGDGPRYPQASAARDHRFELP